MDHRLAREPRLAVAHQCDIGGGATHVEGDDTVRAGQPRRHLGTDDAGARARQHSPDRQPRRCIEPDYAAV